MSYSVGGRKPRAENTDPDYQCEGRENTGRRGEGITVKPASFRVIYVC